MIRILQIVPNMQAGGLENFIMNIYRNIDRTKIQFDFLVHYTERKHFDDEIEKLGGKIYRFSLRDNNKLIQYIKELNNFYKEHKEYKVIHCHMSSIGFVNFLVAKKNGVKVRIAHSHNSSTEKTLKGFLKSLMIKPLKYVSTHNFACSDKAGKYLFCRKKFEIIPNAIEIQKYQYNDDIRKKERERLNIDNNLVIGHIGRFELQKNHMYIIDIFKEVLKEEPNAILLLAGSGSLTEKIKQYACDLGIFDKIKFLGVVKDTYRLYQAMDYFVLPSFFEGLPVVGIEAQVSGLKCLFSNKVTKEVKISDLTQFLEINPEDIVKWKEAILTSKSYERKQIYNSNYDVKIVAKKLEDFYILKAE